MTILRRRSEASRGQTLVEFALILPLLVLILVGIFDFGRAIYGYSTANNAAREAARVAIVDQTLSHVQDHAAQHAVALGVDPSTDVIVDYRNAEDPENVGSCDAAVGTKEIFGCVAVVRVLYTYDAATPLIGNLVGTIQITGEARFPVAFSCVDPAPDPPIECPVGS
jgi:hypothetical protein